jgi:hypothetical protein
VNIWEDREAAVVVRGIASGNETVPTVAVAEQGLVNPSAAKVVAAARGLSADAIPDRADGRRRRGALQVGRWVAVTIVVVAGFVLDTAGHATLNWALDGVAAAIYLGYQLARRRAAATDR